MVETQNEKVKFGAAIFWRDPTTINTPNPRDYTIGSWTEGKDAEGVFSFQLAKGRAKENLSDEENALLEFYEETGIHIDKIGEHYYAITEDDDGKEIAHIELKPLGKSPELNYKGSQGHHHKLTMFGFAIKPGKPGANIFNLSDGLKGRAGITKDERYAFFDGWVSEMEAIAGLQMRGQKKILSFQLLSK